MRLACGEAERLFGDHFQELPYQQRRTGPPWLSWEMCATDVACGRLVEWFKAGWPTADPEDALFLGDKSIGDAVAAVLELIPPPVCHHVVSEVLFIGVGRDSSGWAENASLAFGEPRILVALSSRPDEEEADLHSIIAHEAGHAWLHASEKVWPVATATTFALREKRQRLESAIEDLGGCEEFYQNELHARDLRERQACNLVRTWGFTGRGATYRRKR